MVCRQLGYKRVAQLGALVISLGTPNTYPIVAEDVTCRGDEPGIHACKATLIRQPGFNCRSY